MDVSAKTLGALQRLNAFIDTLDQKYDGDHDKINQVLYAQIKHDHLNKNIRADITRATAFLLANPDIRNTIQQIIEDQQQKQHDDRDDGTA